MTPFQEYPKWVGDRIVHSREEEDALALPKEKAPAPAPTTKKRTRKAQP